MPHRHARIFLLSHMRACTSLAGHILGSHPRIDGYFEMHIGYEDAAALDRQCAVFLEHEAFKAGSRYLFDKLLHNDYRLDLARLGDVDVKLLVALLEPARTIASIVDLFSRKQPGERYADPAAAARYYVERVEWLADFCRSAARPYYYYDAALFQDAPGRLLGKLTEWLALDTPLNERYRLFSQTGMPRKGDSSASIRSGRIERTRTDYAHVRIPEAVLAQAHDAYRECRARILAGAADAAVVQEADDSRG